MNRLARLAVLVAVPTALAGGALLLLWPLWEGGLARAAPLPLPEGDQEVVWLYNASNVSAWERFVTAAHRVRADRPELGLRVDDSRAFPPQTTAVPELAIALDGRPGWVRIRWYKLTSELKTADWVEALARQRPAPLAVIGGSTSDAAIDLAQQMEQTRPAAGAPLLLLTRATTDDVRLGDGRTVSLTSLYPGRIWRFCFTNRQMADAVVDFLWTQDDLRPDADPVYLAYWEDDPYSDDLTERFLEALRGPAARAAARDWAYGAALSLGSGPPLDLAAQLRGQFRLSRGPASVRIPYSVGTYGRPNRWEAEAALDLVEKLSQQPEQRRPLLILPATSQPARRFLHGLVRNAPVEVRRFVVATGDSLAFNTVYRDRELAWPIQDLPFPLVFFCHRNPADERAGFVPEEGVDPGDPDQAVLTSGTEDLLLYEDVIEALAYAMRCHGGPPDGADRLAEFLRPVRLRTDGRLCLEGAGRRLFDDEGNRQDGTGEHVVCLRPVIVDDRQLPQATLEVWAWQTDCVRGSHWLPGRAPFTLTYQEQFRHGDRP